MELAKDKRRGSQGSVGASSTPSASVVREVVMVKPENIIISNSKLNRKTVAKIKKAFDFNKYAFPMGYPTGNSVILTDGNHRATALIEMGEAYIPVVPLTKKEYDYVKFSKRKLDIIAKVPDMLKVVC